MDEDITFVETKKTETLPDGPTKGEQITAGIVATLLLLLGAAIGYVIAAERYGP